MKIEELKLFVKVAELGSFTAAANALDLPRSNVSRKIIDLENALGAKLFHRTTRAISLTNNGDAYYQEVLKGLSILDSANAMVTNATSNVTGRIKLGLLPETHELLQPILFNFQDNYPDVELDVRNITNGFNDMHLQGLDLCFHGGQLFDSDLVAKKILSLGRCLVASPSYLEKYGKPTSLDDLRHHQCICFRWPSGEVDDHWHFSQQSIKLSPKLICNSVGFVKSATMLNRGISFVPKLMVSKEIYENKLEIVLDGQTTIEENGWLLYQQPRSLNTASRTLIDHLLTEVPKLSLLS
ncbi:LysR family transcriptional regulator [Photobacterium sanguinicancri]|uniref:LysR family transcriptional regulator n=1 Tax=Photobacterium sanguinicancri TaxID=875932 RepID=UPI003D10531D